MDLLDHPLLKSGGPVHITITDPSVCFYCKSSPLPGAAQYCPSCGFPQGKTEQEQVEFIWKKRALHRQLEEMEEKTTKAGNMLFIAAGLFVLSYLLGYLKFDSGYVLVEGGIVSGTFVGLGFWSRKNAFPAVLTGLIFLVTLWLVYAFINPINIISGIIWKIAILSALIYGLTAARQAKEVKAQLKLERRDFSTPSDSL